MFAIITLAVIVFGALAASAGTLVVASRDGYRRIPTDTLGARRV